MRLLHFTDVLKCNRSRVVCRFGAFPGLLCVQEEEEAAHKRLQTMDLKPCTARASSGTSKDDAHASSGTKQARRSHRKRSQMDMEKLNLVIKEVHKPIKRCLDNTHTHTHTHGPWQEEYLCTMGTLLYGNSGYFKRKINQENVEKLVFNV